MKYIGALFVVRDMERSKEFYKRVLGLDVALDYGANIMLDGGLNLQTLESWNGLLGANDGEICFGGKDAEAYFETDRLTEFAAALSEQPDVRLVHPLFEQPWGQRAVRFLDPDGHVIEVGESLEDVARRFSQRGDTHEQIAEHIGVSLCEVERWLMDK